MANCLDNKLLDSFQNKRPLADYSLQLANQDYLVCSGRIGNFTHIVFANVTWPRKYRYGGDDIAGFPYPVKGVRA